MVWKRKQKKQRAKQEEKHAIAMLHPARSLAPAKSEAQKVVKATGAALVMSRENQAFV